MNRSEFWTVIAAAAAVIVLLWTIWSDVADVRQEVADVRQEVADVHKVLAEIRIDIADLRTEMIRETARNREDTTKLGARIDVLEAAREPETEE